MFGHSFLRINSSYNSRLLSYAINYAANADSSTENGVVFALKGLFGGYFGKYSLLPYYDKLKEYKDTEQRDIWEYNLNLTQKETKQMFRHIWELNNTYSYYYFFTENCSYNMLWLLESGRGSLHLREHFRYQVIPLETVHVLKEENLITSTHYRPSKREILLTYEKLLKQKYRTFPLALIQEKIKISSIVKDKSISIEQKRYIFEASVEYLEYLYSQSKVKKEKYLQLFHSFTTQRAKLGTTKPLAVQKPADPLDGHQSIRAQFGAGTTNNTFEEYFGIRATYHSLDDSGYGFLRGTQIEFLDFLFSYSKQDKIEVQKATILSIVSLTQRSTFFKSLSWRTKFGWDKNYLNKDTNFYGGVGAGFSWGDKYGYIYTLVDPFFYYTSYILGGLNGSLGIHIDKYKNFTTNVELSHRIYANTKEQTLFEFTQGFRLSQNQQLSLLYFYKEKNGANENNIQVKFRYYF